jgi:hypothetical protein
MRDMPSLDDDRLPKAEFSGQGPIPAADVLAALEAAFAEQHRITEELFRAVRDALGLSINIPDHGIDGDISRAFDARQLKGE